MNKRKVFCILIFIIGFCIFAYPFISNYLYEKQHDYVIENYNNEVLKYEDFTDEWEKANKYNEGLLHAKDIEYEYNDVLNILGNGIIGTIKIPKINVNLPIYHGTSEEVLKIGAGHIEGTSFPTGELGTHAVISGHRGLPSSKLFTDLDELKVGDQFTLSILDRELTYEIDQIEVVEPNDVDSLKIEKDKNYVTLVTCTPYGINSHRLLIRGVGVWKN